MEQLTSGSHTMVTPAGAGVTMVTGHEIEELEAHAEHEAKQARLQGNHAVTSGLEWWR